MGEAQAGQFTERFCDDVMEEAARTAAAQSVEDTAAADAEAAAAEEKQPARSNRCED